MNLEALKKVVMDSLENSKAVKISSLNVNQLTTIADIFIICSATSSRHAKSIQDNLLEALLEYGVKPLGVEGDQKNEWILIDLVDIVIHIMQPEAREFYALEKLWTMHVAAEAQA